MVNNEQTICNAMRDTWRMLVELVENASQILNKLLARIVTLIDTIVNSVFRNLRNTMTDLKNIISAYTAMAAIDQSMARRDFCKMLYACQPAADLIWKFVSPDMYNWFKGPDKFTTPDLSKWGIPQMNFNSKFEVFDYVACRLSLKSLYDTMADKLIQSVMDFLNDYRQYVTVDWYLKNTWLGRFLVRQMDDYEDAFNEYPKKYMKMLEPYLECAFTACDYSKSTFNYMEDFRERYNIGKDNINNPLDNWKLYREEMLVALSTASNGILSDIDTIVPEGAKKVYDERETRKANENIVTTKNNDGDDALKNAYSTIPKRDTETKLTPTSVEPK